MLDQKEGKIQELKRLNPNDPNCALLVQGIADDLESIDRILVGLTE